MLRNRTRCDLRDVQRAIYAEKFIWVGPTCNLNASRDCLIWPVGSTHPAGRSLAFA